MKKQLLLAACPVIIATAPASHADAVLDWNAISTQAILAAGRHGPSLVIDFAVAQATVHDAIQAYDKTFEPYATDISGAAGSPAATVAKATRDILVNRFPAQTATVDAAYANFFSANDLELDDPGVAVGAAAAAGMIALRERRRVPPPHFRLFTGAGIVGIWRPTPSFQPGPPGRALRKEEVENL